MTTQNQRTLEGILDRLRSIESGKNYGPLAEIDALAEVAEDLDQLGRDLLTDKLQLLAEDIIKKSPSVASVIDAQGCDAITLTNGDEVPSQNYPAYHALKTKWEGIHNSYAGTYATRKDSA